MKPSSTEQQRQKFISEFKGIIAKAPEKLQNEFGKNSIIIFPTDDNPIIESGVQEKLPQKLKFEFNALMNKLKSRVL